MKINELLTHAFASAKGLDVSSTFIGLGLGATEMNPFGANIYTLCSFCGLI